MSIDEPPCRGYYTDENMFCYEDSLLGMCVYPTKIFTHKFKTVQKIQSGMPSCFGIDHYYFVLNTYFDNEASKKYIVMLDESEWKFWFIHVIIQLRKLKTSTQWKEDGELDFNLKVTLDICHLIFDHSNKLELSEKSFQVPKEFFQELASCIDVLSPRLPNSQSVQKIILCASLLEKDSTWKIIEKSGLLVQILRCSAMSLDHVGTLHAELFNPFYYQLTKQLS